MAGKPVNSIVIPTYNRRTELLKRAIGSVFAQSVTDWELIVSDDEASPGETWSYLERLAAEDPRVVICRNSGAHGQAGNVNNGLKLARADWVKILHDDDVLRPQCLDVFLSAVNGDQSVALVMCLADHYDNGRLMRHETVGARSRIERLPQRSVHLAMYLQDVDIGMPTQVMVNRRLIDKGILFEESENISAISDSWWFARLLQHGDLLMINEVLVEEHQGEYGTATSNTGARKLDAEYQFIRELVRPMIDMRLNPPPLHVTNQSLCLIRAINRLAKRKPHDAFRLATTAWHPQAWWLTGRWLLRRLFPGRFEIVARQAIAD